MRRILLSLFIISSISFASGEISFKKQREKELQEMIDEGKPIEVKCHFCNKAYDFNVNELEEMLKKDYTALYYQTEIYQIFDLLKKARADLKD